MAEEPEERRRRPIPPPFGKDDKWEALRDGGGGSQKGHPTTPGVGLLETKWGRTPRIAVPQKKQVLEQGRSSRREPEESYGTREPAGEPTRGLEDAILTWEPVGLIPPRRTRLAATGLTRGFLLVIGPAAGTLVARAVACSHAVIPPMTGRRHAAETRGIYSVGEARSVVDR